MTDECMSGRHNYDHLGYTCEQVDEQLRVAREIALASGTAIVSMTGPTSVWNSNGDPVLDEVIPDGIDAASGAGVYASGAIDTAHDDDARDA